MACQYLVSELSAPRQRFITDMSSASVSLVGGRLLVSGSFVIGPSVMIQALLGSKLMASGSQCLVNGLFLPPDSISQVSG